MARADRVSIAQLAIHKITVNQLSRIWGIATIHEKFCHIA